MTFKSLTNSTSLFHLHRVFIYYVSSFFQMLGCFLGPRSFDNFKGLLACKQAFLPITFSGIGLIFTTTITLTTYLRSWVFVVSIITTKFMVNQHPFLFEALTRIDNNTSKWLAIFYRSHHVHVFFLLNNSLGNKWFNFRIPSLSSCTIIPFSACFPTRNLRHIMLEIYHLLALRLALGFQFD
jgi:hypothetical protein